MSARNALSEIVRRITPRTKRQSLLVLLSVALMSAAVSPLLAQEHTMGANHVPARLVQIVQDATRKYLNVNNARGAGYAPFLLRHWPGLWSDGSALRQRRIVERRTLP